MAWRGAWGPAKEALEAAGVLATRGGGEAAHEPNPGVTELAGREEIGAASGSASGRERLEPPSRGLGPGGAREAYRRANRWRERPVGRETGGGAAPPGLREGWR